MDSNMVLAGTIIAAVLALLGVIWQARPKPEPLSETVRALQTENVRLNARINEQQTQIDDLSSRLGTVTKLERDKSRLMAGVFLLTNQLRAADLTPVWEITDDLAGGNKGDTGPHRTV